MRCIICERVGAAWDVVMAWHIAMKVLVNAEKLEEVRGDLVGGSAALSLPVEGGEIVRLAQDGSFSSIILLAEDVEMQQSPSQFQI
jgi:hypothetical protein